MHNLIGWSFSKSSISRPYSCRYVTEILLKVYNLHKGTRSLSQACHPLPFCWRKLLVSWKGTRTKNRKMESRNIFKFYWPPSYKSHLCCKLNQSNKQKYKRVNSIYWNVILSSEFHFAVPTLSQKCQGQELICINQKVARFPRRLISFFFCNENVSFLFTVISC